MSQAWDDRISEKLGRSPNDPLVREIVALLEQITAGRVTIEQANDRLRSQASATNDTVLSFAGANIDGNITLRDVAGRDIITIAIFQLPPAPPSAAVFAVRERPNAPLFGREPLLDTVRARLCRPQTSSVGLSGLPGVGKTRFALEIVHDAQIQAFFSGGVLMTSLGQQPDLIFTLKFWATHLGTSLDPKDSHLEQATQLFATLHRVGKPFLVVIDDIWSADDVRPLLPSSPFACMLLTSRERDLLLAPGLIGTPDDLFTLDSLDDGAAVKMLQQLIGLSAHEDVDKLQELVILTGKLPLLLGAVGSYLRDQRQQQQQTWFSNALTTLHQTASRLGLPAREIEQAERNQRTGWLAKLGRKPVKQLSTNAIIKLSVAVLPHETREALVWLSALPAEPISFGSDSAEAIIGAGAQEALRQLVARHFVREIEDGRFALHRVVWDWATNNHYDQVRDAQRRLAGWQSHLVSYDEQTIELFEQWRRHPDNWQHLLVSWRAAINDLELLRDALRYFVPALIDYAYWNEVRAGLLEALHSYGRRDRMLEAQLCYLIGGIDWRRAAYVSAQKYGERALHSFKSVNNDSGQAVTHALLGLVAKTMNHYNEAHEHLIAAINLTPDHDQKTSNYAVLLNNLGNLLREQKDYAGAHAYFEQALSINLQVLGENHPNTAHSYNNLGALLDDQGDYTGARPYYEKALAINRHILGDTHPDTARSFNNLGNLLHAHGNYIDARPYLEQGLLINLQVLGIAHPHTGITLNNLGNLLCALGEYETAHFYYKHALAISEGMLGAQHPITLSILANLYLLSATDEISDTSKESEE